MLKLLLIGSVAEGTVPAELAGYVSAEIEYALSMEGVAIRGVVDGMLSSWDAERHGAGGVKLELQRRLGFVSEGMGV